MKKSVSFSKENSSASDSEVSSSLEESRHKTQSDILEVDSGKEHSVNALKEESKDKEAPVEEDKKDTAVEVEDVDKKVSSPTGIKKMSALGTSQPDSKLSVKPSLAVKNLTETFTHQSSSSLQRQSTRRLPPSRHASSRRAVTQPKVDPVTLLSHKQPNFQGNFNTMAVFETMPSMYTKERFEELQQKRRVDLPFEYLYWLSRFDPQAQDGYHLENIIDKKIAEAKEKLDERINIQQANLNKVNTKMTEFEKTMLAFRNEVVQISKLRNQMHDVADQSIQMQSTLAQLDYKVQDLNAKQSNSTLTLDRKIGELTAKHDKLDVFAHKPNNFLETMRKENEKLEARIVLKIDEINNKLADDEITHFEEKTKMDEWMRMQEELHKINVEDIKKARIDIDKGDRKFTVFEAVLSEFNINIEALKTHALSTDLHLESSLPLQIASIAFDVGLGTIMKKQFTKYRTNFKKRVKILEKNYQDCSDPYITGFESNFKKNHYELPEEYLNPTKMIQQTSTAQDDSGDGSPSKSKEKRKIPKANRRRSSVFSSIDKTIGDLQNDAHKRKRRDSSANRVQSSQRDSTVSHDNSIDLPKSISKQLLDTLTKWQPMDSRWTIGKLYQRISSSVTEFLKIPMNEMATEQFYSLYTDVNNQELGFFQPLPMAQDQMNAMNADEPQMMPESFSQAVQQDNKPKSALKNALKRSTTVAESRAVTLNVNVTGTSKQSGSEIDSPGLKESAPKTTVGFSESPISPIVKSIPPPQMTMPMMPQFARMMGGGMADPRTARQQERLEKAEALKQQQERRKLQEQLTSAIETVHNKVEIQERTNALKFKRLDEIIQGQKTEIEELKREQEEQKLAHQEAIAKKDLEIEDVNTQIIASRLKIKTLVGDLEESITQQIKIPQLQLLHTEYMRLREVEQKGVEQLLQRKADIKAFALANGGKVPKDDGIGIIIRKELTSTRSKLRIVKRKIKKFGELGKIPMGASHKIYHEESDSSESLSSTSDEEESESSVDSDGFQKPKKVKIKQKKELLSTTLVYQPTFRKVVKESSNSLGKFKDIVLKSSKNLDDKTPQKQKESSSGRNTPNLPNPAKDSIRNQPSGFGKSSAFDNISVGKISEVESVSQSSDEALNEKSLRVHSQHSQDDAVPALQNTGTLSFRMIPTDKTIQEEDDEEDISPKPSQKQFLKVPTTKKSRTIRPRHQSSDTLMQVMNTFSSALGNNDVHVNRNIMTASVSLKSQNIDKDSTHSSKDKQSLKLAMNMAKTINYNSRKASNQMLRTHKTVKRQQKMRDAEAQTDPIRFGEIQLESDSEEEESLKLNRMKTDAGTDAPQFLILNVVPGRPDSSLFERLKLRKVEEEKPSRIKSIVAELKEEKIRKGEPVSQDNIGNVVDRFALLKGEISSDIRSIQLQNKVNQETYTCYKQHQDTNYFNNAIEDQKKIQGEMSYSGGAYIQSPVKSGGDQSNLDNKSHLRLRGDRSVISKSKSVRRGGMRSNREEDDADTKSHMTRKSGKTAKSFMSKKSRRKTMIDKEEAVSTGKKTHQKSVKSRGSPSRKDDSKRGQDEKIKEMNRNLNKSLNGSFIDSSFSGSLSDDDEDEESEEDDYVTFKEFVDFKNEASAKIKDLTNQCDRVINKNMELLKKIDTVDWNVVNQAETKISELLGEFQLSCDGLLMTIEADIKRWKTQHVELETKNETMQLQIQNLTTVTDFLREEFFGFQDENWSLQENLIKFAQVQVGLAEADELDKQNISLVGHREVSELVKMDLSSEEQIIGLDPSCKGCQCSSTLERTTMLQNLKLACLMYKPNPVTVYPISSGQMPRTDVVMIQRQITDSLASLAVGRKIRLDRFREELQKLDEEQKTLKLQKAQMSPTQSTLRFIQNSEEKVLSRLNFELMAGRAQPHHIQIQTSNPSAAGLSPMGSPRYEHQQFKVGLNSTASNVTQMRKPILQGKIDSRAVIGLKKNLNTASTFTAVQKINERASYNKLSHTASDRFKDCSDRPGDQNYKTSTPQYMLEDQQNSSMPRIGGHLNDKATSKSYLGGHTSRRIFNSKGGDPQLTGRKPQTAATSGKPQDPQKSAAALQSLSPRANKDKISIQNKKLDGLASNSSMPASTRIKSGGHRFSQEINSESELPALSHRGSRARNQNAKSHAEGAAHWHGGINITMEKTIGDTNYDHQKQLERLNKTSTRDFVPPSVSIKSRNQEADEGGHEGQDTLPLVSTAGIRVEVRNSYMFGPSDNPMLMSDEEIREVRRNVIAKNKPTTVRNSVNATSTKVNSSGTTSR